MPHNPSPFASFSLCLLLSTVLCRAFLENNISWYAKFPMTFLDISPLNPFSTRKFPILHLNFSDCHLFSHLPQKITCHPSHLKINFHPKFSYDFFSHYLPNKNFSPPNSFGKYSGLRDFYTFLLFLSKRSSKSLEHHDLLCDTAILTYKICIPHFHFPVCRTGAYRHKKSPGPVATGPVTVL